MLFNFVTRAVAMLVFLAAGYFLLDRVSGQYPAYVDMTSENLYTLDTTTTKAVDNAIAEGTEVTIEAYISEEVPADFVPVKKQLQTLLAQYDRLGGGTVVIRYVNVTPTSKEATLAEEVGIDGKLIDDKVAGKTVQQKVYLGAVVKTANGDAVLPSFDGTSSIEYEITRAIAALTGEEQRLTIGVLETDMHFLGLEIQGQGVDLEFGKVNSELEKFYRLRKISATDLQSFKDLLYPGSEGAKTADLNDVKLPDVLMVPGVSSLDQATMDNLVSYIQAGKPTLLMDDPVPFYFPTYMLLGQMGMLRGPDQPRFAAGSPPAQIFNSSSGPKASLDGLKEALGIDWTPTRIVWNSTTEPDAFEFPLRNPVSDEPMAWPDGFGSRQNALVFFQNSSGESAAFNPEVEGTSGLRDLLMIYAGTFEKSVDSPFEFIPWVSTNSESGTLEYAQYTEVSQSLSPRWDPIQGRQVVEKVDNINPWTRQPERVLTATAATAGDRTKPLPVVAQILDPEEGSRNVILFSDMDFISDLAFDCADAMPKGLDNVSLLQNAIEALAGDTSFLQLRGRRPKQRPLERIAEVKQSARKQRLERQAELEKELDEKLAEAQNKLDEVTEKLQSNQELSFIQRLQMTATAASEEQRRFDREMKKAEKEFDSKINELEVLEKDTIQETEQWTRFFAVLLPPLPALAIGIAVVLVGLVKQSRARR